MYGSGLVHPPNLEQANLYGGYLLKDAPGSPQANEALVFLDAIQNGRTPPPFGTSDLRQAPSSLGFRTSGVSCAPPGAPQALDPSAAPPTKSCATGILEPI